MEELPSLLSIHLAWGRGQWPHPQFQREKYMLQDQSLGYPGLGDRFNDGHVTSARPIRQYLQPLLKLLANGGSTTCIVKLVSKPRSAHIIFPPRRRSLPINEANTEKSKVKRWRKKRCWHHYLSTWIQLYLMSFTYVIFVCFSKFTLCLEPVWASFLPWNQESWLITSSGKTVTAALCHQAQHFFSFASSASSIQTMQIVFSMAFFTCSSNPKCPLSSSFLVSFIVHVNSQPQKATLLCSNSYFKRPPHHLLLHHLMLFPCHFVCLQVTSPVTLLDPRIKYFSISPHVFNTMFNSSFQHLSSGLLIKPCDGWTLHPHTCQNSLKNRLKTLTCSSLIWQMPCWKPFRVFSML